MFDLSSIPANAVITNATLYIYTSDSNAGVTISLYRVTTPWSETMATWNTPWTNPGGDFDNLVSYGTFIPSTNNCMVTLNLTSLVAQWINGTYPNDGILLRAEGVNHAFRFVSKEETVNLNYRPRLNITFLQAGKKVSISPNPLVTKTPFR